MEYKRFHDTIVVRIDRGEEILTQLKEVALKEKITLASVQALGFRFAARHLISKNFSAPRSAPNPASVTT